MLYHFYILTFIPFSLHVSDWNTFFFNIKYFLLLSFLYPCTLKMENEFLIYNWMNFNFSLKQVFKSYFSTCNCWIKKLVGVAKFWNVWWFFLSCKIKYVDYSIPIYILLVSKVIILWIAKYIFLNIALHLEDCYLKIIIGRLHNINW